MYGPLANLNINMQFYHDFGKIFELLVKRLEYIFDHLVFLEWLIGSDCLTPCLVMKRTAFRLITFTDHEIRKYARRTAFIAQVRTGVAFFNSLLLIRTIWLKSAQARLPIYWEFWLDPHKIKSYGFWYWKGQLSREWLHILNGFWYLH